MICSACGKQIPDSARFCPGCGAVTSGAAKSARPAPSAPAPYAAPAAPAGRPTLSADAAHRAPAAPEVPAVPSAAAYAPPAAPSAPAYTPPTVPSAGSYAPTAAPSAPAYTPTVPSAPAYAPPRSPAAPAAPQSPAYGAFSAPGAISEPAYRAPAAPAAPAPYGAWTAPAAQSGAPSGPVITSTPWEEAGIRQSKADRGGLPMEVDHPEARRKPGAGLRFLSVLLAILAVVTGLGASVLGALRLSYSPEAVKEAVRELDLTSLRIPMDNGLSLTLPEFYEDQTGADLEKDYGITEEEVNRVLEASFVKDFLGEVLADYTGALLNDEPLNPLSRNRVVDFFRANDAEIKNLTGFSFLAYEHDSRSGTYRKHYDLDELFDGALEARVLDLDYIRQAAGLDVRDYTQYLARTLLIVSIAVTAALLLLQLIVYNRFLRCAFTAIGVSLMVLGCLDLLGAGAGLFLLKKKLYPILYTLVQPFPQRLLMIGGIVLGAGLVVFLLRFAVRKPGEKKG